MRERAIWIVDAHRDEGRRFVVYTDEILESRFAKPIAAHQAKPYIQIRRRLDLEAGFIFY